MQTNIISEILFSMWFKQDTGFISKCQICFVKHPSISKCHKLVASHLTGVRSFRSYPAIQVRMQSGRCYESRPVKIVFSFRILLKRFDLVSSTAFLSMGFRHDSCLLNQAIFHLKSPQALKKQACVFSLFTKPLHV